MPVSKEARLEVTHSLKRWVEIVERMTKELQECTQYLEKAKIQDTCDHPSECLTTTGDSYLFTKCSKCGYEWMD